MSPRILGSTSCTQPTSRPSWTNAPVLTSAAPPTHVQKLNEHINDTRSLRPKTPNTRRRRNIGREAKGAYAIWTPVLTALTRIPPRPRSRISSDLRETGRARRHAVTSSHRCRRQQPRRLQFNRRLHPSGLGTFFLISLFLKRICKLLVDSLFTVFSSLKPSD
jgi:hypothetical protein